jgi:SAM-dependent methyltransferase
MGSVNKFRNIPPFTPLYLKWTKLLRGWSRRHRPATSMADAQQWWDKRLYAAGVGDAQTLSAKRKSPVSELLHYRSIEYLILRHLARHAIPTQGARVLDLGSGAGHWIEFFLELGARELVSIEIAPTACDHLRRRFENAPVHVVCQDAVSALSSQHEQFDIISAVGFMFHIVDDVEWETVIQNVGRLLRPGGILVVGGHFGFVDGLNVQVTKDRVYKRLRSGRRWRKVLRKAGLNNITIVRNRAYLYSQDTLPENNLLFARH